MIVIGEPALERFIPLVATTPLEVTSDDDSDHGEHGITGGYLVREVTWRSVEFDRLLMDIDSLALLLRYNEEGVRGRGAIGRVRYRIAGFADRRERNIPFTLPRNCYDGNWVSSLDMETREELESQWGDPISLALDPSIKA